MVFKVYDLAVKTGEYKNNKGETKSRWQNVGAMMEKNDGGRFLMLARWFNPAGVPDLTGKGGESILISMFEPKQADGNSSQQSQAPRQQSNAAPSGAPAGDSLADMADDIPF